MLGWEHPICSLGSGEKVTRPEHKALATDLILISSARAFECSSSTLVRGDMVVICPTSSLAQASCSAVYSSAMKISVEQPTRSQSRGCARMICLRAEAVVD